MASKHLRALVARLTAWIITLLAPTTRKRAADALLRAALALRGWPRIAGGAPDGEGDGDSGETGDGDGGSGDADGDGDGGSGDGDDGGSSDVTKLRAELRKHRQTERRAKDAEKRARDLEARLKKIEDEGKSEHEKALATAREEAAAEATSKFEDERRADRLELATTRLASKGVKVGEDTVKFADPDDALAHLERAIKRGDVDGDEIFTDGKVNRDALATALAELLEDKPHLRAANGSSSGSGSGDGGRRNAGDADAGKGKGAGKSLEEMTPDDHLKEIQGRR